MTATCPPPALTQSWDGRRYRCQRCGVTDSYAELIQCHYCYTMLCPSCVDLDVWNYNGRIRCKADTGANP